MPKPLIDLVFRKSEPYFNSIENVFNAVVPHLEQDFNINRIELPYRTTGVRAMIKNYQFLKHASKGEVTHVTGHENYVVGAVKGKAVLTLHDINSAFTGASRRDRFINKYWFVRPVRKADYVTVISNFSANELKERYKVDPAKVQVVSNPVDDRVKYNKKIFNYDQPTILQVGTKKNKNLERVAEALSGVDKAKLLVLGKLSKKQLEMLNAFDVDFQNKFHVPYDEVLDLYKIADILMFPSLYEGFGMPILEAQATGRPVITSSEAAMPDTAGDGALMVDPRDVEAIRTAVQKLIKDAAYREEMVRKGRENTRKYSAEVIAKEYAEIYRRLIGESESVN
ncbi:MAG TPA: glycosyltransferase family 1 protein [Bacteroidales bacterium]|nr:glycosyltransferase family 1 protein [Bacteroidales bacterium]